MSWSLGAHGSSLLPRIRWLASAHSVGQRPWTPRIAASAMAVAGALALVTTLATMPYALALTHSPTHGGPDSIYTISAVDPMGEFTLTLHQGRALGATIDGTPVPREALVQTGRRIRVVAGARPILSVQLNDHGGISWKPRIPADR